jgi:MFS family permease
VGVTLAGTDVDGALTRLRSTAFPLLWLSAFSYMLISTAERFTFTWLVIETLDGPSWAAGLVLFALGLPVFVFVLPAGALADRWDRKRMLMTTQLAGAAVTGLAALLVATGLMTVPLAVGCAALLGAATAFGTPIRSSLVPAVVPKALLMRAIAITTIGINVAMVIGPLVGGLVIRAVGVEAAFAVEAGLFLAGFAALVPLRLPPRAVEVPSERLDVGGLVGSIRAGLRFVWGHAALRSLFFLLAVGGFLMMGSSSILLPQVAKDVFGRDAAGASRLFALMGLGMIVTSTFLLVRRGADRKGFAFLCAMVSGCTCQTLQGVAPSYLVLAGMMVWWGLSGGFYLNLNQTLIQTNTPAEMMGRVMSLHTLVGTGLGPLGSLVAGAVAGFAGPKETLGLFGAAGLVCVLVTFLRGGALRALR